MANFVDAAQKNSGFLQLMQQEGMQNPFLYALRTNTQPYAIQPQVAGEEKIATDSAVLRWEIPRYGVLKEAHIEVSISTVVPGVGDEVIFSPYPAIGMFDRIELRDSQKVVATLYRLDLLNHVKSLPSEVQDSMKDVYWNYGKGQKIVKNGASLATDFSFRCPLPFSFFTSMRQALYVQFVEQLEIHAFVAPSFKAKIVTNTLNGAATGFGCKLVTSHVQPNAISAEGIVRELRAVANNEGAAKLQYNSYREVPVVAANAQKLITMPISCPYPTWRISFTLSYDGSLDGNIAATINESVNPHITAAGLNVPDNNYIDKVEILTSGSPILSLSINELLAHMARHKDSPSYSSYDTTALSDGWESINAGRGDSSVLVYTIYFCDFMEMLMGSSTGVQDVGGTVQTNVMPWGSLSHPQLRVTLKQNATNTATKLITLLATHSFHQFTGVNADNGRITNTTLF